MLPIGPKVQAHAPEEIVDALDAMANAKGVKRPDALRDALEFWYEQQYLQILRPAGTGSVRVSS